MIKLHKLNGTEVVINADLVESIESVPDTKIILTSGNQYIVKEPVDEVVRKFIEYKSKIEVEKEKQKNLRKE
ncbi:MAG: flagellar FlbD family protein [Endomicrobia bacterium]|nr:flagellar FlbD family protein [Endomicrobiia bacterium]MCX7941190.1 flagellar FlbD family protein [Endomicrobiia bacterium]MDW8056222.1 flagellar FlbD family protein [Elusimicrobiota bacterium]